MDDAKTPPTPRPEPPTADEDIARRVAERLFGPEPTSRPPTVGRFRILRLIGAGGMGTIHLAHDDQLDRKVALKSLRRLDSRSRERSLREAQAMARVKHPNVVEVHEVIELDGEIHIVMEYIEGATLADWQRDKHWRPVLEAYVQAGRGLAAAHDVGLLHRDFKPSNVLISTKDSIVRVADFGLAVVDDVGSREVANWLVGTREYLAPEIYAGSPASVLTDQFSYCISLWEAVYGERPFTPEQLLEATRTESLPLPRQFGGPRWLQRIIARGLELDPRRRWPSMVALVDTLEQTPSRRRRLATGVGLGSLGALALGFSLVRDGEPPCPGPDTAPEFWNTERRAALVNLTSDGDLESTIVAGTIERELAAHAARHAQERADLCIARRERETVTEAAFERGNVCLDHVADRTAILVDSLLQSDRSGFMHVDGFLAELPDPASCRTPDVIESEPSRWWLVPTLDRLAIDRGWAASAAGDQPVALELAERVLSATPSPTNELGALALRASALQRSESTEARAALRTLVRRATRAQADEALFDALTRLAVYDSTELENVSSARITLDLADVVAERLGRPASLTARLHAAEAEHALLLGDLAGAQEHLLHAIERHREAESPRSKIAEVEMRLAYVHALRGETEMAVDIYSRLRAEQVERLGSRHVNVGTIELNLGITLADARDWRAAKGHLERATSIFTGASHMRALASASTKLAEVETELGDHAAASRHAESAWAIQLRHLSHDHSEYGQPLRTLAWTSLRAGEWEAALRHHEALLGLELSESEQAAVHETMGWLLCRLGRFEAARPHAELATTAADPIVRIRADMALVEVELAKGAPRAAATRFQRIEESLDLHDVADSEIEAELAWLRVQIAVALESSEDVLHSYMVGAWRRAEYLVADQNAILRSLIASQRNRQ
jgi:tetratricopeptide (TPR) repeat protein/predicted Ser/Thr protein kinase